MLGLGLGLRARRFGGSAAAPAGTITIDTLTYTRGTAGVAPTLASTVSDTGTTTANYTLRGVLAATAQTEAQIDASGNKFEITAATLAGLDGSVDLSNSETAGVISAYIFDSSDPVIKSAVVTETGVTYDAAAPVFSSAEVGTVDATSLIVTFDKALYGSTSAADWDVQVAGSPATESAAVISGSTVDITLGTAVTNGQAVTVAYTGTGLVGVDAEQVATFTAETVTNNVAAPAYAPTTITFGSGDLVTAMNGGSGLTPGNELIFACRVTLPSGGSTSLLPVLGPSAESCLFWWDGNGDGLYATANSTSGSKGSGTVIPTTGGTTYSILFKAILRTATTSDVELWIDGVLVSSDYDGALSVDPAIRDIKMPKYLNSNNGSAADVGFSLEGGLWISNSGFDSLAYSDFFDGSNNPIFNSATINSVAAQFFQNGSAADWNAGTNDGSDGNFTMTGAVV